MLKSILLTLCLLISSYSVITYAKPPYELSLKGLDGNIHSINEYIGQKKWLFVNIWGPKCPPCIDEMPDLQNFHDDHKNKDAIVLGIALDFPSFGPAKEKDVREFVDDYFIDFPVLLGDANSITHLGGGLLRGTPTTLIFNPKGKLETLQVGQITQVILENFLARQLQP